MLENVNVWPHINACMCSCVTKRKWMFSVLHPDTFLLTQYMCIWKAQAFFVEGCLRGSFLPTVIKALVSTYKVNIIRISSALCKILAKESSGDTLDDTAARSLAVFSLWLTYHFGKCQNVTRRCTHHFLHYLFPWSVQICLSICVHDDPGRRKISQTLWYHS